MSTVMNSSGFIMITVILKV